MSSPGWYEFPDDPIRSDFRNFLYLVWQHLGLPEPTPGQYEVAYFLQWGYKGFYETPSGHIVKRYDVEWEALSQEEKDASKPLDVDRVTYRADIIMGFRGVGKSYISAAFALWKLYRDPRDEKILVVSASGVKSREFVSQVKAILMTMDLLEHLRPRIDQRDMVDRFDVNGASISQSPSLKAAGITGQITGSRATTIIPDDIEITENSRTEDARMNLLRAVNEFDAIIVPGNRSQVCFLGTPQTEESIYGRLIKERGFNCFCLPARYPRADKRASYVLKRDDGNSHDILAPFIRQIDKFPELEWKPTDPRRFNDIELQSREAKGRSFFMLQYMLDTSLSDAERYPLKQHDLIVMSCNPFKAPTTIQWGHDTAGRKNFRNDIPNVGFSGDYFLAPMMVDPEWRDYSASTLFVDPSGRGTDETAWAIVKELHGMLYVLKIGGYEGDVATSMEMIARDAKLFNVSEVVVEPNYGGVMWIAAFQPILARVGKGWSCSVVEDKWAKGQKEARIIDTLEPVMNQHRLIVDESVAKDQTLMYQMTHLAKERNCLTHDDRVDALSGAIARLANSMMVDMDQAAKERADEELDRELEDFIETCTMNHDGISMRRGRGRYRGQGREFQTTVEQMKLH